MTSIKSVWVDIGVIAVPSNYEEYRKYDNLNNLAVPLQLMRPFDSVGICDRCQMGR